MDTLLELGVGLWAAYVLMTHTTVDTHFLIALAALVFIGVSGLFVLKS